MSSGDEVAARLARVRERIAAAAARAGRDPGSVLLVAVTKDVAVERVREALAAGARDLGENRAQELTRKMEALAGSGPRWHFIGTLQRNKVRAVVGNVALIHSVDSVTLGRAVAARAAGLGRTQDVLLEVNAGGEATKHGFPAEEAPAAAAALAAEPGLRVVGLMTVAPPDPGAARVAFRALRELRDRLRERPGGEGVTELSMGMTADLEAAVEEGATIVRIGTAIFGPRNPAPSEVPVR